MKTILYCSIAAIVVVLYYGCKKEAPITLGQVSQNPEITAGDPITSGQQKQPCNPNPANDCPQRQQCILDLRVCIESQIPGGTVIIPLHVCDPIGISNPGPPFDPLEVAKITACINDYDNCTLSCPGKQPVNFP